MPLPQGLDVLLVSTVLAGAAIPAGGLAAWAEHLRPGHLRQDLLHGVVAFGGGILVAAVALVLVPEGVQGASPLGAAAAFLAGAVVFLAADRAIERRGGGGANLMAMVMDYLPESVALGAAFAIGGPSGPLLALLVGLQNLPEGFNSYRELGQTDLSPRARLALLAALVPVGPLAAMAGFFWLAPHPVLIAWLVLFAAGGILYLVFHDIAPMAHREGHWVPTLGAVLGFLAGMVGQALLGAA